MAGTQSISVDGAAQFVKALRETSGKLPPRVKKALTRASQIIVDDAKPKVPIGPGRGGHAASSITVAASSYTVKILAGGSKYPYYPWLDFGGTINKHTSRPTKRPFIKGGRYIWASWDRHADDVVKAMAEELSDLISEAGLS